MLTPADIENKRFGTTRLKEGYDQDEVDGFLDDCGAAMQILQTALANEQQRTENLRSQIQRLTEAPTSVQATVSPSAVAEKLLAAAQVAADQHIAEAKAEGEALVRTARLDGDRLVNDAGGKSARMVEQAAEAADKLRADAEAEAERIKTDGYAEKYRAFQELEVKHSGLSSSVKELEQRGSSIREALNEALNRYDSRMGVPQ